MLQNHEQYEIVFLKTSPGQPPSSMPAAKLKQRGVWFGLLQSSSFAKEATCSYLLIKTLQLGESSYIAAESANISSVELYPILFV